MGRGTNLQRILKKIREEIALWCPRDLILIFFFFPLILFLIWVLLFEIYPCLGVILCHTVLLFENWSINNKGENFSRNNLYSCKLFGFCKLASLIDRRASFCSCQIAFCTTQKNFIYEFLTNLVWFLKSYNFFWNIEILIRCVTRDLTSNMTGQFRFNLKWFCNEFRIKLKQTKVAGSR